MQRVYDSVLEHHFASYDQMAFVCGPRQVGKTTIAHNCKLLTQDFKYLSWDNAAHRSIILSTDETYLDGLSIDVAGAQRPIIVFDEIHKYTDWKNYLKGFIDTYKEKLNILVTGSAKLNVYRRGGDSLMGRYFLYRAHPLSVGELLNLNRLTQQYRMPKEINEAKFNALYQFGGFPEPFMKQEVEFYNRWKRLRLQQVIQEDIRDLGQVQEISQLEVLAKLLQHQTSHTIVYRELAKKVRVAETTIKRWLDVLEAFYYCYRIKPWTKNITRSLLKEPKVYLWDWSVIADEGARLQNFVASHLLKAVHYWTDAGLGEYELYYLRDKEKREVDFLVSKDDQPWMLVEVKKSGKERLSDKLLHFQKQVQAEYVFQVALDLPYIEIDCFSIKEPKVVPLKTFLSQLV